VGVGSHELALPLDAVARVLHQPLVTPLPGAPRTVNGWFELEGEAVVVVDLAEALEVAHATPLVDRVLVVLRHDGGTVALCADRIHDPVEIAPDGVLREPLGPANADPLAPALIAFVRHGAATLPVLAASSLVSAHVLEALPRLLQREPPAPAHP
jgi:chemotaxis signal transduction protein